MKTTTTSTTTTTPQQTNRYEEHAKFISSIQNSIRKVGNAIDKQKQRREQQQQQPDDEMQNTKANEFRDRLIPISTTTTNEIPSSLEEIIALVSPDASSVQGGNFLEDEEEEEEVNGITTTEGDGDKKRNNDECETDVLGRIRDWIKREEDENDDVTVEGEQLRLLNETNQSSTSIDMNLSVSDESSSPKRHFDHNTPTVAPATTTTTAKTLYRKSPIASNVSSKPPPTIPPPTSQRSFQTKTPLLSIPISPSPSPTTDNLLQIRIASLEQELTSTRQLYTHVQTKLIESEQICATITNQNEQLCSFVQQLQNKLQEERRCKCQLQQEMKDVICVWEGVCRKMKFLAEDHRGEGTRNVCDGRSGGSMNDVCEDMECLVKQLSFCNASRCEGGELRNTEVFVDKCNEFDGC